VMSKVTDGEYPLQSIWTCNHANKICKYDHL